LWELQSQIYVQQERSSVRSNLARLWITRIILEVLIQACSGKNTDYGAYFLTMSNFGFIFGRQSKDYFLVLGSLPNLPPS
jgi:hypothetical protein